MTEINHPHVCPWWLGYMLVSPLRRFLENPEQILGPYVREGMTVLEIGPGMGYYSLPFAQMVGKSGRVICVDVQEKMLQSLQRRAARADLLDRITTILASKNSLHLEAYQSNIDFISLYAVVHEVPDKVRLFEEAHRTMKPDAVLLFAEPNGHVKPEDFEKSVDVARSKGFGVVKTVDIWRYHAVLMSKTA